MLQKFTPVRQFQQVFFLDPLLISWSVFILNLLVQNHDLHYNFSYMLYALGQYMDTRWPGRSKHATMWPGWTRISFSVSCMQGERGYQWSTSHMKVGDFQLFFWSFSCSFPHVYTIKTWIESIDTKSGHNFCWVFRCGIYHFRVLVWGVPRRRAETLAFSMLWGMCH